jgi:hypothetical protein
VAASILLTSAPATAQTPAHATCSGGYISAIIGGQAKCLRAGEYCSAGDESDYEHYGFTCIGGRLQSYGGTPAPATTTAATTTAAPPPTTTAAPPTTAPPTTTSPPPTTVRISPAPPISPGRVVVGTTRRFARRSQTSHCTRGNLPDRQCSPGAVYTGLTRAVLCSPTFRTGTIRNVPESEKHQVEVEYGMAPKSYGRTIEIDHIVSLELGGSNDIANLFPEPGAGAFSYHVKDKLENRLHDMVCSGAISLSAAQRKIASDWISLYESVIG